SPPSRIRGSTFFFHAEDGIRGFHVTGVQTCALPIFALLLEPVGVEREQQAAADADAAIGQGDAAGGQRRGQRLLQGLPPLLFGRSEERRVGKGCRCPRLRGRTDRR